jgi:TonB family protein
MNAAGDLNAPPPPPPPPAPQKMSGFKINGDGPTPLYVIDGVIVTKAEADKISPETIASVFVLKDKITTKPATEKYGEKGKNGAVEIKSRNNESHMKPAGSINISADSMIMYKDSIIIVNPKPYQKTDNNPFIVVEEMPEFPGGTDAMVAWITSNLKYPAEALKRKITGKVYVNFAVSSKGKVKNVVVSKSANPLLNAEAIRVISSMPDWKPGTQGGKSVEVQIKVPVEFKLK